MDNFICYDYEGDLGIFNSAGMGMWASAAARDSEYAVFIMRGGLAGSYTQGQPPSIRRVFQNGAVWQ